jgi:hypothetical protein
MTVRKFDYALAYMFEEVCKLGVEGWELVAVLPATGATGYDGFFYLKREYKAYER